MTRSHVSKAVITRYMKQSSQRDVLLCAINMQGPFAACDKDAGELTAYCVVLCRDFRGWLTCLREGSMAPWAIKVCLEQPDALIQRLSGTSCMPLLQKTLLIRLQS